MTVPTPFLLPALLRAFIQGNAGNDVISVTSHVKSSTVRGVLVDSVNIDGATISSAFIQGDLGNDTIDAASSLIKSTVYGDNSDSTTSSGGADSAELPAVTTLSASNVFAGEQ